MQTKEVKNRLIERFESQCSIKADPSPARIEQAAVETFNGKSVHHCLRQRFSTLTALEARVISVILSQCTINDKTLLKVVADETHVSKAMLVKIAKKLGFDGFRSLRAALALQNRLPLAKAREELRDQLTIRALAEKALGASLKALEEAFSLVSFENLEQAAQWLYAARQRDFYGLGASAQVARDAACKFLRIGLRGSAFDDGLMMLMSASLLQKGDVAVAFSYSGQTLIILEAVRQARKNGAHVIAVTNSPGSRLTQVANVTLCTTVEDSPLTGESGAARIAQLNLLDALFMAVAQSNPTATEVNLSRTMSVVRTQRATW
jgi:RpiR family transcriptional regulator, repressor of rpiB and als operon